MHGFHKLISRVLIALALIAAALIVFVIAVPRLVNLESVQKALVSAISQRIGGEVTFERIDLVLLPGPHLVVTGGRVTVPPDIQGRCQSLSVSARLLPLLLGRIEIGSVQVEQPDFTISVAEPGKMGGRQAALAEIAAKLKPLAAGAAGIGAPLVTVRQGRLAIRAEDRFRLDLNDLNIRVKAVGDRFETTLRTRTDFCEAAVLQAAYDPKAYAGRGRVELKRLRPERLPSGLLPEGAYRIGESLIDLAVDFRTDKSGAIDATMEGDLPQLTVIRGEKHLQLQGHNLKAGIHRDDRQFAIILSRLNLERPDLALAARFRRAEDTGQMDLEIRAADLEVAPIRRAAMDFGGDFPAIRAIFDIVRGGRLPTLDFAVRAESAAGMADLANMTLNGRMVQGDIVVPELRLPVREVDAQVQLAAGTLQADHIRGRYADTTVLDGRMRLGLPADRHAPFHLDIGLSADLRSLLPVLKQVVNDARMERIAVSGGHANGRLILGEALDRLEARTQVTDFTLQARAAPLSAPLSIGGKGLVYRGTRLTVEGLTGRLKNSSVSLGAVDLDWGAAGRLEVASGGADLRLEELYKELSGLAPVRERLRHLQSIRGTAAITAFRLSGAPASWREWDFQADGGVQNFELTSDLLPAPLSVPQALFSAAPQALKISQARVGILDAAGTVSGRLNGYLAGIASADLALQGTVGPEGDRWLQRRIGIPAAFAVRSPLVIQEGRLRFGNSGETAFSGDLRVQEDLKLSLDMSIRPGRLDLRQMLIRDEASNAFVTLRVDEGRRILFGFRGNLQKKTVDSLLVRNRFLNGWVKGDLRMQYALDHPMASVFEGNLSAGNLVPLPQADIPFKIGELSLAGVAHNLKVTAAVDIEEKQRLKVAGQVNYSADGVFVDADLAADGIELDRWAAAFGRARPFSGNRRPNRFWDPPLQGVVRVDAGYVTYGRHTLRPARGTVALFPEKISVAIDEAGVCGISTPGTLTFTPQEIALALRPYAKQQEIEAASNCLLDASAKAEGRFDLNAEISGRGPASGLQQALAGSFHYKTGKGRFYAGNTFNTIREILAIVNITEIFRGRLPELGKESFGFDSIEAKGKIRDNKLLLEELVLDGFTVTMAAKGVYNLADGKMDMTVLVAPLKTVDAVVRLIPLLGDILGGSLISVPVGVKGDLQNPEITILPLEAVGEGLLGIIKRTLQLPVKIISPLIPNAKKEKPN